MENLRQTSIASRNDGTENQSDIMTDDSEFYLDGKLYTSQNMHSLPGIPHELWQSCRPNTVTLITHYYTYPGERPKVLGSPLNSGWYMDRIPETNWWNVNLADNELPARLKLSICTEDGQVIKLEPRADRFVQSEPGIYFLQWGHGSVQIHSLPCLDDKEIVAVDCIEPANKPESDQCTLDEPSELKTSNSHDSHGGSDSSYLGDALENVNDIEPTKRDVDTLDNVHSDSDSSHIAGTSGDEGNEPTSEDADRPDNDSAVVDEPPETIDRTNIDHESKLVNTSSGFKGKMKTFRRFARRNLRRFFVCGSFGR
ncbi:uncharacterized protein LOC141902665 [Tubulanus polymorphus]|uniref:uncharacterized protein LOC141902665 n=1 Tax=Tubulanus polymorphus TaxID=672921 RepID=UPI003DA5E92A